ncbi:lysosomal cobalamin transporter ABCD4-like isoform X2 [Branchiostoma floridae]|uniref:Lysosomal cobalamin transporter ABCD4-like isoform X1 n=1 Tax=Branchiostoma floridae TaxID=7739 RepID=A0A9J7LX63_BRAFL|nr:lysosomal cobalamin transporter ABCD4-like isoform X1 [Branchiostoma floridae]XP_035688893.1 lysosomal cobalamin transporter ABCD4-like isoform X2 [Branchiostoma floridae]
MASCRERRRDSDTSLLLEDEEDREEDTEDEDHIEKAALNILFCKRFWHLLKVIFPKLISPTFLMFCTLLAVCLLEQVVIYQTGLIPSQFVRILAAENPQKSEFMTRLWLSLIIIGLNSTLKSLDGYISSLMYVRWRRLICHRLHQKYFQDTVYYQLNVLQENMDNPDQRISQDVERFCKQFSLMIAVIIISPFTIGYYTYQCYISTGWQGPVSIFVYFVTGTIINRFIMSPIVSLLVRQEKLEGDFRFKHMQIRVNAESAAFYRACQVELMKTNFRLHSLLDTQKRLINREFWLNFAVNMFDYLGSILSYIVIAIPILSGAYSHMAPNEISALVSKNAFVSIYLIGCFSGLIDLSTKLTDLAGYTHRIGELLESLEKTEKGTMEEQTNHSADPGDGDPSENASLCSNESTQSNKAFQLESVTLTPPSLQNRVLIRDLNLEIEAGRNLLIVGNTGSGKSSLLRVLRGLWPTLGGSVERISPLGPQGVMFIPQKPYLTDGSLREQIIYPLKDKYPGQVSPDDGIIMQYLERLELMSVFERAKGLDGGTEWINWYDVLSPGEMQRLSFARLFFHQPQFAVLDEATSAVSMETEELLYNMCKDMGMTVISVGHRSSLRKFHDVELKLDGRGGWKLDTIR